MRRTKTARRWAAALGLTLTMGFAATTAAEAKDTYLYGTYLPNTHQGTKVMERLFDRMNADSQSMEWEMHVAGSMGGARDLLAAVRDGIVHSGHIVDVYAPSEVPRSVLIAQLALLALENLSATAATNETFLLDCPSCMEEMREHNVVPLAYYATTPQVLMCNREVRGLEDLAGQKVRSVGPIGIAYKHLGAVPVNTDMTELYDALQRGQVDCASGAEAWLKDIKLWEVVEIVYSNPFATYTSSQPFNLNADTWEELPDADKKIILGSLAEVAAGWAYVYVDEQLAARTESQKHGVTYREMPNDIQDALAAYRKSEAERAIAWGESKGIENAREIVETYLANLQKWEKIVTDLDGDRDGYREALQQEIFSKVAF